MRITETILKGKEYFHTPGIEFGWKTYHKNFAITYHKNFIKQLGYKEIDRCEKKSMRYKIIDLYLSYIATILLQGRISYYKIIFFFSNSQCRSAFPKDKLHFIKVFLLFQIFHSSDESSRTCKNWFFFSFWHINWEIGKSEKLRT